MLQKKLPWHLDFARHAGRHRHVDVDRPATLTPEQRSALAISLSTFQIGEDGTGEHLLAAAKEAAATRRYRDALAMFVIEEQEHARLLALVLRAIDHPLRTSHWTDRVFVFIRQIKSLRSEVLTLLVAELIALSYYSAMRDGVREFADVFGRIYDDEVRHVDFHADTLPHHLDQWSTGTRALVRVLWNVLVVGSSVVAALDHRAALRVVGVSPARFVRSVWTDLRNLDQRLFSASLDS